MHSTTEQRKRDYTKYKTNIFRKSGGILNVITDFIMIYMVMLTCGCVSSSIIRDYYPGHNNKGYAILSARIEPRNDVLSFEVYQQVDGVLKHLANLQAGGMLGGNSMDRNLSCAYQISASALPGAAFYVFRSIEDRSKEFHVAVDIHECMTTRVTAVISKLSSIHGNNGSYSKTYSCSFEIDDQVKGKRIVHSSSTADALRQIRSLSEDAVNTDFGK